MVTFKKSIPERVSKGSVSVSDRIKALNKTQPHAVLATALNGKPYTSLVAFALTTDGKGILFATPKASTKYRNIVKNKHVSLLIDTRSNTGKDYMKAESITILGTARPLRDKSALQEATDILAGKHPALSQFIRSPKTALILVEAAVCMHVTRFQSVTVWKVR
jgi:nitroimidazol reductase NimA-like FMN-containing flavoprotein (pyridoxamine 5'-phosphate oxidase superfamily)